MKIRFISAIVAVILLLVVLALGSPFIEIAVTLLTMIAVYELLQATGLSNKKGLLIISVVADVVMTICIISRITAVFPAIYVWLVALFIYYMSTRPNTELKDIATSFVLTVYVCFMFGHLLIIYGMNKGATLIWSVLVCAFLTDTFAMLGGRFFGKHKLCPQLSPKKTVEGAICGVIGCVISMMVYCLICQKFLGYNPNYLNALIIGAGASVVSQLGDLSASCIKRQFGIKDYGNIMPGHGGVMDRIDSLLFVSPFICYALTIFPIFM